jgi:hypothetical protein
MADPNTLKVRVQSAYHTEAEWNAITTIPKLGEILYTKTGIHDGYYKIGDNIHQWKDLEYIKPSYNYNEIQPVKSKTYSGIYGSENNFANATFYFASLKPDSWTTTWHVKYRIYATIPNQTNYTGWFDVEMWGNQATRLSYNIFNCHYSTGYRSLYFHVLYSLTSTGFNNGYGHLLGIGLRSSANPTSSSYPRTFKIDILVEENCTVTFNDTVLKYANVPGTGATNYNGYSEWNGCDNGLQETGDSNDTTTLQYSTARLTAGSNGLPAYSITMMKPDGTWEGLTVGNATTATTSTKNSSGFVLGQMYLYWSGTNIAANGLTSTSTVRTAQDWVDMRYTLNCGTTLTSNQMVYLKGTVVNGLFYLDNTWWTQTLPTTADNFIYIPIGMCYGSGYALSFWGYHGAYYHDGTNLREYITNEATQAKSGLMSSTDKTKLDGIETGANKYVLPVATSSAIGGVKSGTDINVDSSGNVSVVDNSHNHTIANVTNLQTSLDAKAPLASPALTGTPTAPTATAGTNTTQVATTAFVKTAVDNATNNVEIGGRNYVMNSKFTSIAATSISYGAENCSCAVVNDSTYGNCLKAIFTAAGRFYYNTTNVWQSGQKYAVSFLVKADGDGVTIRPSRSIADFGETMNVTSTWSKYTGIIDCTNTNNGGTLSFSVNKACTVYVTYIKLEKGNKPTDWTPAPEDLVSSLSLSGTTLSYNNPLGVQRGSVTLSKSSVGLDNVENKSSATIRGELTSSNITTALGYTPLSTTGNASTASALSSSGTIKTDLTSTSAVTYTSGGNITPGVTGTLGVGNGGTGQTSAKNAANSFLNALDTGSSTPADNDYYISQYVNGGTTTTTYHRRPVSALYSYIKGKTDLVYLPLAQKGANSGVAELDSSGKVPISQLPSYVSDVIEAYYYNNKMYAESAHTTELTGEDSKIYVDLSTNKTYRWSGSAYIEISQSLALGETSSTAYRGDRGKIAYDHSQMTSGNPHNVNKNDIGLGNVENKSSATIRGELTSSNITTALGYTPTNSANYLPLTAGSSVPLSNSLYITRAGECGVEVNNTQSTNPNQVAFIVGSSGNGGIYSRKHNKWIVYADPSGNVALKGNADTATSATTASYLSIVAGNEIRFAAKPSSAQTILVGYKWSDGTSDAKINRYKFCNGNGASTEVEASTFYGSLSGNATSATTATEAKALVTLGDKRSVATTPDDYKNRIVFAGLKTNTIINSPSSDIYSYVIGFRGWSDNSGGKAYEFAFNNTGAYYRLENTNTTWNAWNRILTKTYGDTLYLPLSGGTLTTSGDSVFYTANTGTVIKAKDNSILQSPVPKYLWHDLLAFCRNRVPKFYTTTDGSTWTEGTLNKNMFAQRQNIGAGQLVISSTIMGSRWVWESWGQYSAGKWLVIGVAYTATNAKFDVILEESSDLSTWTSLCSSLNISANSEPIWIKTNTPQKSNIRLTIIRNSEDNTTNSLPIVAIQWLSTRWGNQGLGSENEYPYDWDAERLMTFHNTLKPYTTKAYDLGTSTSLWNNIYSNYLYLNGSCSATMTASSTNPKIVFSENGSQPVSIIYTDYDTYRAPAGLKVIGGTSATPAWFEVEGNIYEAGTKLSSKYILLTGSTAITGTLRTTGNLYTRGTGETAIGVGYKTENKERWLYLWGNNSSGTRGMYDTKYGYVIRVTDTSATFTGDITGTATNLSDFAVTTTSSLGNIDTYPKVNAIGYVSGLTSAAWNYQHTDGALYTQYYSASWQHEIFGDYRTGQISVRGKNNGTWQSWRRVLDETNFSSFALPLTGGTISNNLTLKTAYNLSAADNGVSSTQYPTTFAITDASNRIIARLEGIVQSDGVIGSYWYIQNYDTSGTRVGIKGIKMSMDKSGNLTYTIADPANFRSAISAPAMVTGTYPAILPTNGTNNWIQVGTSNTSYGLLPSQGGGVQNGHNYLGTSSWYWGHAYIDHINANDFTITDSNDANDVRMYMNSGNIIFEHYDGADWYTVSALAHDGIFLSTSSGIASSINFDGTKIQFNSPFDHGIITNWYGSTNYNLIHNHNNGNISISASSAGLYLGYENTTNLDFLHGKAAMDANGNFTALGSIVSSKTSGQAAVYASNGASKNRIFIYADSSNGQAGLYSYSADNTPRAILVRGNNSSVINTYGDWVFTNVIPWKTDIKGRPMISDSADGNRVSLLTSGASGRVGVQAQFGNTGTTYSMGYFNVAASDIRLKEHVKDSKVEALPLVNKIKIREFDWKDGRHQTIGMVADELEELDKALTIGGGYTDDNEMSIKSVDTFYLVGYLVKAVQELSSISTTHEDRITQLEKENKELREQVTLLKSKIMERGK